MTVDYSTNLSFRQLDIISYRIIVYLDILGTTERISEIRPSRCQGFLEARCMRKKRFICACPFGPSVRHREIGTRLGQLQRCLWRRALIFSKRTHLPLHLALSHRFARAMTRPGVERTRNRSCTVQTHRSRAREIRSSRYRVREQPQRPRPQPRRSAGV